MCCSPPEPGAGPVARKRSRVDPDGTSWLLRSIAVLRDGGCDAVVVVVGSEADRARDVLARSGFAADRGVTVVDAPDWQQGMGSSLRRGLFAAQRDRRRGVLVHLVDLPDVTAEVVRRLLREAPRWPGRFGPRHLRRPARPPGPHRPRPSAVDRGGSGRRHWCQGLSRTA